MTQRLKATGACFLWLMLGLSNAALAENWVELSTSADKKIKQYLDVDSIDRNLGSVEVHRLLEYPQGREINGKRYVSQRSHLEFDCSARSMRQVQLNWHTAPMGQGETLAAEADTDWQIDSFDEFTLPLWKLACEGLKLPR